MAEHNQEEEVEEFVAEENFYEEDEAEDVSPDAEFKISVDVGDKDQDVYTEKGRENLEEDDEIEPWEEGFSRGADH